MHPIRLIVPGPSDNTSDIYMRYLAGPMATRLGQPVIVENRPGANGFIGAAAVLQAPADGYSVFVAGSSPMAQNVVMLKSVPYDPVKDFRWVSGVFSGTSVLVVAADSPYRTLQALVAAARAVPKALNYGASSAAYRLTTEWLNQAAGMQANFINYKGAPQVTTDVIGGHLHYAMVDVDPVVSLIRTGQLRALLVTGEQRNPLLPETPTLRESGLPSYDQPNWVGLAVRSETPDAVVAKLSATMRQSLADPATKRFSEQQGLPLLPLDDKQMAQFHRKRLGKSG